MNLTSKVVVLTGAGSGIGRALAVELAARGCDLALSDINRVGLSETVDLLQSSNGKVSEQLLDVSDRDAMYRYADRVIAEHGHVDIVINNAGVSNNATIEDVSYDDFEWVININMWGVIHGTKAFLPHLSKRPEAYLVNISSLNAMCPFPNNGPYNMSKYAVLGLNETLMLELRGSNIHVMSVHPGGIKTNIARNSRHMSRENVAGMEKSLFITSADDAARDIAGAIQKDRKRLYIGRDAKMMQLIKRISPSLALKLAQRMADKVLVPAQ